MGGLGGAGGGAVPLVPELATRLSHSVSPAPVNAPRHPRDERPDGHSRGPMAWGLRDPDRFAGGGPATAALALPDASGPQLGGQLR